MSQPPRPTACPICRKPAAPATAPFCSKRCADIDLGRWFGEAYSIPAEPAPSGTADHDDA